MSSKNSGIIRWSTELDPDGPNTSRVTPHFLAGEPVQITRDWLYSPEPISGTHDGVLYGEGGGATKNARRLEALIQGLGLRNVAVSPSVMYELRSREDKRYVQSAFTGLGTGAAQEHFAVHGDVEQAFATRPAHVTIVTGGCLGSNQGTVAETRLGLFRRGRAPFQLGSHGADEHTVSRLLSAGFVPDLVFYELENAWRSACAIAKVISRSPGETRFTINLNVPREEYYTYILRYAQAKKISRDASIAWFDQDDERNAMDRAFFRQLLQEMLGNRYKKIKIVEKDELAPVGEILRGRIRRRFKREVNLQDLVDVMRNQGDPIWDALLSPALRPEVHLQRKPLTPYLQTVQELCGASYTAAVLRASQNGPVISINDYVESTIQASVDAFTPVIAKRWGLEFHGAVALFPYGKIIPSTGVMYRQDPGRDVIFHNPSGVRVSHPTEMETVTLRDREVTRLRTMRDGERFDLAGLLPSLYAV
ncbi:hypothetical protein ACRYCC_13215 [Actinomadura scrupuli]|uniref:hypothetical protein n=1 Tax=Actinomadura scrupuli TaxID=559629 RepID=UPI003D9705CD